MESNTVFLANVKALLHQKWNANSCLGFTVEDEAQTFQLCRPITEESSLWLHPKSHTLVKTVLTVQFTITQSNLMRFFSTPIMW